MTDTTVNAGIAHGLYTEGDPVADTKAPGGPIADKWTTRKFEAALVNPANRRKLDVIIVGTGLAGGAAAATLGEAGYNVKSFCYQDIPAPRALDRRPGRHQRREELQGGRRLHLPALLRHGQGRRLPLARVQRLPAGRGQRQHHRPVRRAGRAVRPRVRRPARQPLLRRRPGLAHLLRPRPDRPAAAHRRLPGAGAPGRRRHRASSTPATRCSSSSSSTAGPAASSPATWSPARSRPTSPTPSCSPRGGYGNVFYLSTNAMGSNVTATLARAPQGRLHGQPLLHADPPDLHPGVGRAPVQADPDVGVAAQRRPHLGAEEPRRLRQGPARDPRGGPRLLPRADLPRASATWCPATSPRARRRTSATRAAASARWSATSAAASTSTSPTPSSGWARRPSRRSTATSSTCTPGSPGENPYEVPMRIYPAVHYVDGRPVGRLRPAVDHPRPVRHRRGQLLRPRRQPARRLGADAGPGRRLLRAAEHDPRLPRQGPVRRRSSADDPAVVEARTSVESRTREAPGDQRRPQRRLLPPGARQHHVGVLRHGAHRGGPAQGHRPHPRPARGVLAQRARCSAPPTPSTRASRRPAGWPTSSSSAS